MTVREIVRGVLIKRYAETHGGFTDRSTDEFDLDAGLVISALMKALEVPSEGMCRACHGVWDGGGEMGHGDNPLEAQIWRTMLAQFARDMETE